MIPTISFGQVQIDVGPEGSIAIATLSKRIIQNDSTRYNNSGETQIGTSLRIGGTAHIQIGKYFGIRSSIYYKYSNLDDTDWLLRRVGYYKLHDFEIPINILLSWRIKNNSKFYIGVGPNFSYTIDAKSSNDSISLGKGANGIKPFAVGINAKLGVLLKQKTTINLFFNAGRGNRYLANRSSHAILRNSDIIGLSIGYLFPLKIK